MAALRIHTDEEFAGLLDRLRAHGSTFRYGDTVPTARAVSITMPVVLQSYDRDYGLHPIFDMNLPEGRLREHLMNRFRKAAGTFDDFDLISIVGRSQIGRIRFSGTDADLEGQVPFQSVDEILRARRGGGLIDYLLNSFAEYSGISGVQPKVMVRDPDPIWADGVSPSFRGATHIVKLWEPHSFPELAANEYFCMRAAERAGLPVPSFQLADDGEALVVDRFDLKEDGSYRGVEDFCCLNGYGADKKYKGGYERAVFKRAGEFMPDREIAAAEQTFRMIVFNAAIRNGDAHLKNFAVVYDCPDDEPTMAPAYDLITTTVYIPEDQMALTINGRPNWPDVKSLRTLARTRTALSGPEIDRCFEATADALSDTMAEMQSYIGDNPQFAEIGGRMNGAWNGGIADSLGLSARKSANHG